MKPLLILVCALAALPARADEGSALQRDPTVPPAAARPAAPAASGAADATGRPADPATPPRHLMVLNGKPYVIERGWPRGVGDKLGEARIERIEGSTVWLRDASGTRKFSLYPGVEVRPAKPVTKDPSP
jgi:hypothetical protein